MTDSDATPQLDAENPWPGLEAFQENARAFFHGRDHEAEQLLNHVIDDPVTVLYGRSGLGKTSLLRAGLFPLLREHNFLPIYVRFDLKPDALPLDEQILNALRTSVRAEAPDAIFPGDDESLWEYLHRKDFKLWSAQNYPLTPVIVLDQFEELYTLGERVPDLVETFRNKLGNLAENRIPATLAARIDADYSIATRLQLRSRTYRLLISLREDFLPELEGWCRLIPSLGDRYRVRLKRLQTSDAFDAVYTPAAHMMTKELAQRIIAIIAGGDLHRDNGNQPSDGSQERRLGEVEPPLLSLFCRELNEERKRRGQTHFDKQLVEESKGDILSNYYQSCVASMPDKVAKFIETKLITEKGFRCSVPRDEADLTDDELSQLIRLRLLRVEERYDTPCIELTHDVLTGVVRGHREDREKAQLLADAAEREAELEAEKKRTRTLRILVAVSLVAALVAVFAFGVAQWKSAIAKKNLNGAEALRLFAKADLSLATGADQRAFYQLLAAQERLKSPNTLRPDESEDELFKAAVKTRNLVRIFHPSRSLPTGSRSAITRDGSHAIVTSPPTTSSKCNVRVWSLSTGIPIGPPITAGSCQFFADPNAQRIVTIGDDDTIQLWDTNSGKAIADPIHTGQGAVSALLFSSDGRVVYTGGEDGSVRAWDLTTQNEIGSPFRVGNAPVKSIGMSGDGRRLVSAAEETIQAWDATTRQRIGPALMANFPVRNLSVSFDGRIIAARSSPGGQQVDAYTDSGPESWDAYIGSGQRLGRTATGSGSRGFKVRVWDATSGAQFDGDFGILDTVTSLAVNPPGDRLLTGTSTGVIQLWDLNTGVQVGQEAIMGRPAVRDVGFAIDGSHFFASTDDGSLRWWQPNVTRVWQPKLSKDTELQSKQLTSMAITADGQRVATGDTSGEIQVHEPFAGGSLAKSQMSVLGPVYGLAFSFDGRQIVSAAADGTIQIWDAASGERVGQPMKAADAAVWTVAFSPDGRRIVSGDRDGAVRVWNLGAEQSEWHVLHQPNGDKRPEDRHGVTSVAYSSNGQRIISGSEDGTVRVWDASNHQAIGNPIQAEPKEDSAVWSIAISPDGKRAVSGGGAESARADGTGMVQVWDIDAGESVRSDNSPDPSQHHRSGVRSLAFSPNGKWIVSGGDDGSVRVWSTVSGEQIGDTGDSGQNTNSSPVIAVAVSSDGHRVTFGARNGLVQMNPGPEGLTDQICAKLVANMSHDQWGQLVPERGYVQTCPNLPIAPDE